MTNRSPKIPDFRGLTLCWYNGLDSTWLNYFIYDMRMGPKSTFADEHTWMVFTLAEDGKSVLPFHFTAREIQRLSKGEIVGQWQLPSRKQAQS